MILSSRPLRFLLCTFIVLSIASLLQAQDSARVIPLWTKGAPGFENRKDIPEEAKDWWVKHVNNPTLTVYPAPANASGNVAVVVCPGGGFRTLVYNAEGKDAALYLNSLGITAFVLKYRLFRDDSMYTAENPKQDIFRAMRLVRSRAKEFNIDSTKIGVMGFSAGGEVAGWLAYHFTESHAPKPDAIDQLSARPAFQVLIYPGPLAVPDTVLPTAPSTFMLVANGDECCSEPVIRLLQMHRKAKVPVEAHIYSVGVHGFNMGKRSTFKSLSSWPDRLTDWFKDAGITH
ncbi:MAG TPA: alpha/beta hydrolase [Chitinophagaceae bacterium]|nr:alpha/beta hydrolase [Chitinophagaceae bacterium]